MTAANTPRKAADMDGIITVGSSNSGTGKWRMRKKGGGSKTKRGREKKGRKRKGR